MKNGKRIKKSRVLRFFQLGFTLAELIVVITILAILATVGFLALSGYSQDAKDSAMKTNVRSVYTAITAESALTGNSPRYYVIHDSGASLSWGVAVFDGVPTALTGGDWNAPNTNYSAGNPDFAKLKINPDKFKISFLEKAFESAFAAYDPKTVSVGAAEAVSILASGRKHVTSYVQVAGISPVSGAVSVTGNYPVWSSGSVSGLIKNQSSTSSTGALMDAATVSTEPIVCDATHTGSDCSTKLLTISANKNKLNLFTECTSVFGSCTSWNLKVTINAGVTVYSDNVDVPALITGTGWGAGTLITIENKGNILGARYPVKTDRTLNRAYNGGTALQTTVQTVVINSGNIIGGSGSGGPGEGDSCWGCGGGNWGTYGGIGGAAVDAQYAMDITNTGNIYGAGGGGAGGGGGYALGYGSGDGGNGAWAYLTTVTATAESGNCGGWASCGWVWGTYGQAWANGWNAGNGMGYGWAGWYAVILNGKTVTYNGATVTANGSYTEATWLSGTKWRVGS